MYPDLILVINEIQKSKIKEKALVCKAVQEYYKHLYSIQAVKAVKKPIKVVTKK